MPVADSLPDSVRAALSEFTTVTTIPVQWGDEDAFGHVNNVVYFRWFESARIDLLLKFESSLKMSNRGVGPILASIKCDYRQQLMFPDTVHIGSRVDRIGRTSFDIVHHIYSQQQQVVVSEGHSVIVVFDYDAQRPRRLPSDLKNQMNDASPDSALL
jgi:acyl-CoA thioester hydrolase